MMSMLLAEVSIWESSARRHEAQAAGMAYFFIGLAIFGSVAAICYTVYEIAKMKHEKSGQSNVKR